MGIGHSTPTASGNVLHALSPTDLSKLICWGKAIHGQRTTAAVATRDNRLAEKLERLGLVERWVTGSRRRRVVVRLTEHGKMYGSS